MLVSQLARRQLCRNFIVHRRFSGQNRSPMVPPRGAAIPAQLTDARGVRPRILSTQWAGLSLFPVERRDPHQLELPVLDGDTAGFAQQHLAVMNAEMAALISPDTARIRDSFSRFCCLLIFARANDDVPGKFRQQP